MRIGICSPGPRFREVVASLLAEAPDFRITPGGQVREMTSSRNSEKLDVIIVDGKSLTHDDACFLIGVSAFGRAQAVVVGPMAFDGRPLGPALPVDISASELIQRVREAYRPPEGPIRRRPSRNSDNPYALSAREYEIACLVARGMTNRQISETTQLKLQGVENLISTIFRKLRLENRTQLAITLLEGDRASRSPEDS